MIVAKQQQSWIDQHEALALAETDHIWLNEQREAAILAYAENGLPERRDEDRRYTNLLALGKLEPELASENDLQVELPQAHYPRIVFVDGKLSQANSTASSDDFKVLSEAWQLDSVEQYFGSCVPKKEHGFLDLNSAYAQDGYVIELKAGQNLGTLEVVFVWQQQNTVSHVHNLIIAEANSQCTIIERHIHSGFGTSIQ